MLIKEFSVAFVIALIFSTALILSFRRTLKREGFVWFFLLFLMITWAGGVWLQPFGPQWSGVYWLPFFGVAVGFAMIVVLFTPRRPPHGRYETLEKLDEMAQEKQLEKATFFTLGIFFWALMICLVLAVILRHL